MSTFIRFALALPLALAFVYSRAQCTDCIIDQTCSSPDGFPTVCPATLPDAVVGTFYEQFLTFYMPATVTDPGSGTVVDLISIEVTSISGLPFGMAYTLGDDDGIFYPGEGQNLGCATICGTALLPGVFDMLITVDATVGVGGFQFVQSQSFSYTINVVPGEGNSGSFVYSSPAGCGNLDVTLSATLSAPEPSLTTYSWLLPSAQELSDSTIQVSFSEPGAYTVSLTTTISNYTLNSVVMSSLGSGWGGDEDLLGSPDPYITVTDNGGNVVYTSSTVDNSTAPVWTGIGLSLTNPPYEISFYDEDPLSPDDFLGSQALELSTGSTSFSSNGNTGNFLVGLVTITEVEDSVTLQVFAQPSLSISQNGTSISASPNNLSSYLWYRNGSLQTQSNTANLLNAQPGLYTCVGISAEGCEGSSNELLVCPNMSISFDVVQQVLDASAGFDSYQWFFNGVAVPGATLAYLIDPLTGVYSVQGSTSLGCSVTSDPFTVSSIAEQEIIPQLSLFPNPAYESASFTWSFPSADVCVYNTLGAIVYQGKLNSASGIISIPVADFASGFYVVGARFNAHSYKGTFVKH